MSKTFMANKQTVTRKWYIIDATGKPLGKIAAKAALILRGKHKPDFTPHVDTGDHVIIINAAKAILTGKKLQQKYYRRHSGYVGGLKEIQYKHLMEIKPDFAIKLAVKGMLPHTPLGRQSLKKLRVYKAGEHNHSAQKPEILEF